MLVKAPSRVVLGIHDHGHCTNASTCIDGSSQRVDKKHATQSLAAVPQIGGKPPDECRRQWPARQPLCDFIRESSWFDLAGGKGVIASHDVVRSVVQDEDRAETSLLILSGLLSKITVKSVVAGRKPRPIVALVKKLNAKAPVRHSIGPNNSRWR